MSQEINVSVASAWGIKVLSGFIGGVAVALFPTQALMTGLLCYGVGFALDTLTGVSAAIYEHTPITVENFIGKAGRKITQGVAYIGLAWIASKLVTDIMQLSKPIAEPMGFVLAIMVMTEILSIIRNLGRAHNNIPILDKMFKRLMDNLRAATNDDNDNSGNHPAKENN